MTTAKFNQNVQAAINEKLAAAARPYALITVSGGVAEVALNSSRLDIDILDFDNLRESIRHNETICIGEHELAYIREHESAAFIADVERLLDRSDFTCDGCGREESICSANPCEDVIADRES